MKYKTMKHKMIFVLLAIVTVAGGAFARTVMAAEVTTGETQAPATSDTQQAPAASNVQQAPAASDTQQILVTPDTQAIIIDTMLNSFFSRSAFIGNSIGVGLTNYFKAQGPGFLGEPTMLTRGSYSFRNDSAGNPKYMVSYKGESLMAKDAVAKSGAKYVFINMGTNDLFEGAEKSYERYVEYIDGIRSTCPGILFFIESTTPACKDSNVSNSKIDEFNSLMAQYCAVTPDAFYVDISTGMKDAEGYLQVGLSSDKSCHLNNKAYAIWVDELRSFAYSVILMNQGQ